MVFGFSMPKVGIPVRALHHKRMVWFVGETWGLGDLGTWGMIDDRSLLNLNYPVTMQSSLIEARGLGGSKVLVFKPSRHCCSKSNRLSELRIRSIFAERLNF